jgi:hypothetical protein
MKLSKVHVGEFRSVWDSNEFEVGNVTCLVGKTEDYPRAYVKDYTRALKDAGQPATVVDAWFSLDPAERDELEKEFGKGVVSPAPEVNVWRGYDNNLGFNVHVNEQATVVHAVTNANLPEDIADEGLKATTLLELGKVLDAKAAEMAAAVTAAQAKANELADPDERQPP